jgi:DNA processing protein
MTARRRNLDSWGSSPGSASPSRSAPPSLPAVTVPTTPSVASDSQPRPKVGELALRPHELLGPLNELELRFAPERLYIAGRLSIPLQHPRVSIVGTRTPSPVGVRAARTFSTELSRRGVTILSGLARGIDTAAHNAALDSHGTTIAVLGTPLSKVYPRENAALQHRIMEEQLAVSQFPDGHPIRPGNFVQRNRVMALMSDATVIVESGEQGGSLHQGWEAIRLGRPLFIHEEVMLDSDLLWPRKMQRFGAVVFREATDILDFVPASTPELIADGVA